MRTPAYLKQVFGHLREELGVEVQRAPKELPHVPTEHEIRSFYDAAWHGRRGQDVVMIKTLRCTGVRVSELVRFRLGDVDLDGCRIRLERGKGKKDRYVPFRATFKEALALHIDAHRNTGASDLFESSWTSAPCRSGAGMPLTAGHPDVMIGREGMDWITAGGQFTNRCGGADHLFDAPHHLGSTGYGNARIAPRSPMAFLRSVQGEEHATDRAPRSRPPVI